MSYCLKRKESKLAAEATAREAEEAKQLEAGSKPVPAWQTRDVTHVDMHYFPLREERGSHAIMPWFRESKDSAHAQLASWGRGYWFGLSESDRRKIIFVVVIILMLIVVKFVVHNTPTE